MDRQRERDNIVHRGYRRVKIWATTNRCIILLLLHLNECITINGLYLYFICYYYLLRLFRPTTTTITKKINRFSLDVHKRRIYGALFTPCVVRTLNESTESYVWVVFSESIVQLSTDELLLFYDHYSSDFADKFVHSLIRSSMSLQQIISRTIFFCVACTSKIYVFICCYYYLHTGTGTTTDWRWEMFVMALHQANLMR